MGGIWDGLRVLRHSSAMVKHLGHSQSVTIVHREAARSPRGSLVHARVYF